MNHLEPSYNQERHHKVNDQHLDKQAAVYCRQSTYRQAERNTESLPYQRLLAKRALRLGWSEDRVKVIDKDVGRSGRTTEGREGFNALVADVSLGHVGMILSHDVSRLARNNADWYRLLDLCAVTGTLIADAEGIYDPRLYNDRLLLGLKGAMTEAEIHLLRMRVTEGRLSQVRRGEYRQRLPTGLTREQDGTVIKDDDEQVRSVIDLIFAQFRELGSCRKVARFLIKNNIDVPRRQTTGVARGKILFKRPDNQTILHILHNPAYAGAFVHGHVKSGEGIGLEQGIELPWRHMTPDMYPAYIPWAEFVANQRRIAQNESDFQRRPNQAQGAARDGDGLLQGLTICGRCGGKMHINYSPRPWYFCPMKQNRLGEGCCPSYPGVPTNTAVLQAFFSALAPAHINAFEEVGVRRRQEWEALDRNWQQSIERAEHQAFRAQQQYDAVDPRNRLVTARLEERWEKCVQECERVKVEYQEFLARPVEVSLPDEIKVGLQQITDRLPRLWAEGVIPPSSMKELLRCLIAAVVPERVGPHRVKVRIVWRSGAVSEAFADAIAHSIKKSEIYLATVARVRELWERGHPDSRIAERLTQEGFRPARAIAYRSQSVAQIRRENAMFYNQMAQSTSDDTGSPSGT